MNKVDAIIIGGGFYGVAIAVYLAKQRGLRRVVLLEKNTQLLSRASYNNQARVHNGYHYPRSLITAFRSRVNLPRFVCDWPQAVKKDFYKLYAIARRNSKVTAKQFVRFCYEIGAQIRPAGIRLKALFEPELIEDVFMVEEYAFDASMLACLAEKELSESGVQVHCQSQAIAISRYSAKELVVTVQREASKMIEAINCHYIFNCTYSGLNQLKDDNIQTQTRLKHEITEIALMQAPDVIKDIGVTVMDGPFFSMMPFPARSLHTLTHVRYTPHFSWYDERGIDPYKKLDNYDRTTRVDRMMRDAGRYVPSILHAKYMQSLFEVKTVLAKNEGDDGRPILFEKHPTLPGYYSVLGGKIDNIYDIFEKLEMEEFEGV